MPKVFISYCWSSPAHSDWILKCAEKLRADGVDVILDQWDLVAGQDKNVFMEKMVTDDSVTHVLVFSDKQYAEKANKRAGGVGTESQIMSRKVYESVNQSKFLPLVMEWQESGEPYLPEFFQSRIWFDFSTPEKVNDSWEHLIRHLNGKPLHVKPPLGKAPEYLSEPTTPSMSTRGKFAILEAAIAENKATIKKARRDFLDAAIEFADSLRIKESPTPEGFEDRILSIPRTLLPIRDQLIDWVLLEAESGKETGFEGALMDFLERLLALKFRTDNLTTWNDTWFDGHTIFIYETFLYTVAALIRTDRFQLLRTILESNYLLPQSELAIGREFASVDAFWGSSKMLYHRNERLKLNRLSLLADGIKDRATRGDITFLEIMQADLLVFLFSTVSGVGRWYPHTFVFAGHSVRFPLFVRAAQKKYFDKLKTVIGVSRGDDLRAKYAANAEKLGVAQWTSFLVFGGYSFPTALNLINLDTLG